MKIAIITSGILPLPAVQGGAVENLIDYYVNYNETSGDHEITVYSVYDKKIDKTNLLRLKYTKYIYIDTNSFISKIKRSIYRYFGKTYGYYNYFIEYFLYKVISKISNIRYDIIILENRPGYVIPISKITNSKIVLHLHNDLLNATTPHALEIHNCCTKILTVSQYIKQQVDSIGNSSKSIVCYNGIDIDKFERTKESKDSIRSNLGFDKKDFIVVFTGRIIQEKGVRELIDAYSLISEYKQIKILIIGGIFFGNDLDETDYSKQIRLKANNYKENIIFTGYVSYDQIPMYLSCSDLYIIPSLWEDPCPLSCIEGMASGLPLIVTRSGGIPELVDEKCAFILEKNKDLSANISKHIIQLYHDVELRNRMSLFAKERAKLFSKDRYVNQMFNNLNVIYQE